MGPRLRALSLSHHFCVNEMFSPKLLFIFNEFEPAHIDSVDVSLVALFF